MTIDITKFQAVLTAVTEAATSVDELSDFVELADPDNQFDATFTNIFADLVSVEAWANAKILEAEQEQVMATFLAEMKVVFDKYSAKLEVGSSVDGYGLDYGNGTANAGVKFTATFEGTTAVKEVNKSVIVGTDLV